MLKYLFCVILGCVFLSACSEDKRTRPEPKVSQFSSCPKEFVKDKSYCAVKHWWNRGGIAMSNLFEITFKGDCTANYSFHSAQNDGSVRQVTCGSADWGISNNELIVDPDDNGWVGRQNLGKVILEENRIVLENDPEVIFESPCPFTTHNTLCQ